MTVVQECLLHCSTIRYVIVGYITCPVLYMSILCVQKIMRDINRNSTLFFLFYEECCIKGSLWLLNWRWTRGTVLRWGETYIRYNKRHESANMKEHIFKNDTALVFQNRPFLAELMNPDFKSYKFLNYVFLYWHYYRYY